MPTRFNGHECMTWGELKQFVEEQLGASDDAPVLLAEPGGHMRWEYLIDTGAGPVGIARMEVDRQPEPAYDLPDGTPSVMDLEEGDWDPDEVQAEIDAETDFDMEVVIYLPLGRQTRPLPRIVANELGW